MRNVYGTLLLAACAILGVACGDRAGSKHNPPITTTTVDFHGWHDCTRISNGIVEAVVVPQIGRIMSFQFVGQPDTDPLYVNSDWVGKTGADAGAGNWANFGGDKLWPSEQSNWPEYIGSTWPPDTAFDGQPQILTDVPDGVQLTTAKSTAFGAVATRTITLKPGEARLYISQVLSRYASPVPTARAVRPADGSYSPIGIWSITQTRPDATVFVPLGRKSSFPNKLVVFDSNSKPVNQTGPMPTGWSAPDGMLVGRMDAVNSHKLGVDSREGWIASLYDTDIVFSEHYQDQPSAQYPDRGCRNEVYVGSGSNPYFEFEMLGPVQQLQVGEKERYNIYWELGRLPGTAVDDKEAAALVREVVKGK